MSSVEPELEVLYKIGNAAVREYPYPHIYVADIFPEGFYAELRRNLPPQSVLRNLGELGRVTGNAYPERGVLPLAEKNLAGLEPAQRDFWERMRQWLLGQRFADTMVAKFAPYLAHRFGDLRNVRFGWEALIVRDRTRYSADASMAHLGTSIYMPRDPTFVCQGGPHYAFGQFQRMLTMPYLPNAMFAFMKTANSFHGVEPIEEPEVQRDLLLYDVRAETKPQGAKFTF
jgi:hypothetical protein